MARLSTQEAAALRHWLQITLAIHGNHGDHGVASPLKPLAWMVLVQLALSPEESASYADIRAACGIGDKSSLTQVVARLHETGHVTRAAWGDDGRERVLRLSPIGRDAVGRILPLRSRNADS